jgi:FixJ family two-component response regulator
MPQICLVDDDAAFRDSIKTLLNAYGISVVDYATGADFLADPHMSQCSCLILNSRLPMMSGMDVMANFRARAPEVPIVFVTSQSDERIKRRALQLGAMAVLEKPLSSLFLMKAIRTALRRGHNK